MVGHLEKAAALGSSKACCLFAMLGDYYNSGLIDTSQMVENSREVIYFLTWTWKTLSKLPKSNTMQRSFDKYARDSSEKTIPPEILVNIYLA